MLESQRQALPIQTEVPARRASPEDNTIASLRTGIKALHGISEFLLVWVAHASSASFSFSGLSLVSLWSLSGLSLIPCLSLAHHISSNAA
jgi:hypothetical protein